MEKKLFSEFPPVSKQQWEEVITADLKGADYDKKLVWKTEEGFSIRPYYMEDDITHLEYLKNFSGKSAAGQPNEWEIRQDFYNGDIARLASDSVRRGAQSVGISVANVKTADDLSLLLKGIDPVATGIHFIESASALETMSFFAEYLKNNKIDSTKVYGSVSGCNKDSDKVIKEYGTAFPRFRFIEIKAYGLRNMGCTVAQELGFAIANAISVLNDLTDKGFSVDDILPHMALHFATGSNYFIEIAKIRAARVLFNAIAKEYGSQNGAQIFIHSSSATWNKAVYDPYVNMLRSTTETMSAAIGGANSISTINFDCAYEKTNDFSARIARNQQILLKEESFIDKVADPAAGSYYIEHISDSIAEAAWKIFLTVEEKGGYYATRTEYVIPEVEKSAAERLKDVSSRKKFILGVNQYPNLNETMFDKISNVDDELHRASSEIEKLRLETEKAVKDGKPKPKVFLLTYGNLAMRKARAGFATNFFGCAGYEIIDNAGFKTGAEGAKAALEAKADITVLCSSDEEYAVLVAETIPVLKGKTAVVLAGYPKEQIEEFTAQGVEEFIHVRSNVLTTLQTFNKRLR
jgi:methylmalonyl-CoA mutase